MRTALSLAIVVLVLAIAILLMFRTRKEVSPVDSLLPVVAKIERDGANGIAYNVRKTDSLVSPVIAIIDWYSEEEHSGNLHWEAGFTYQDGAWWFADIRCITPWGHMFGDISDHILTDDAEASQKRWESICKAAEPR